MSRLGDHKGEEEFDIADKKFSKRNNMSGGVNVFQRIADVAPDPNDGNFSTGWVNTDGTTAVADAATLTFDHNLGTTDLIVQVYMAKDASGTDAVSVIAPQRSFGTTAVPQNYGGHCTSISSQAVSITLGANGWRYFTSTNQGGWDGYTTYGSWGTTYTHIKVVCKV